MEESVLELNKIIDEMNKEIKNAEEELGKYGIGAEFENIGIERINGKYRIYLLTVQNVIPWDNCSREKKIEIYEKLGKLRKVVEDKIKYLLDRAKEVFHAH